MNVKRGVRRDIRADRSGRTICRSSTSEIALSFEIKALDEKCAIYCMWALQRIMLQQNFNQLPLAHFSAFNQEMNTLAFVS